MKEIRVDRGEDPENEGMETSGSVRDKYWNFENAYFEWENEYVGYIANRKRKGQEEVKDRRDGEISSLVSYKRRIMKKRQKRN